MGGDDFDSYLNEVSGEDVTSGQSDSFRPEPTTPAGQPPSFTETGTPPVKGQPPNTKDAQQKAPPQTPTGTTTPPRIRPHALGGFVNEEGDIVDESGSIIAQKGTVRRVYEENGRLKQRLTDAEKMATEAHNRMRELTVLNNVPAQYGLDTEDIATAMDMAGRVKKGDLLSVAREIVAMAAAQGHNISTIVGENVGDAVDMTAIKKMLETHLGPVAAARQESQQDVQIRTAAKQQYDKFIDDNPYADLHQFEIAKISEHDNISPQRAYNNLMDFARRNQLDFSQPLEPQIRERAEGATATAASVQPLMATPVRPMPHGAAVTSGNGVQPPAPVYADPDDDWGTIIRDAQKALRQ